MYYCDKCGEVIHDINKPCPTCGMVVNTNSNVNNSNNKIFNILIVLIIVVGLGAGVFIYFSTSSYSNEKIDFSGKNYSMYYEGDNWMESDLSTDEYYILQNTSDLNAYLQLPVSARELNIDVSNEDMRSSLYQSYVNLFKIDSDYNYHNITSSFISLENTDNYYLSSDFYMYSDSSLKGKVFIVVSPNGKAVNVLLIKGTKNISSIEEEVYEILEKIEM